jgi:hypothetical protein
MLLQGVSIDFALFHYYRHIFTSTYSTNDQKADFRHCARRGPKNRAAIAEAAHKQRKKPAKTGINSNQFTAKVNISYVLYKSC